MASWRRSFRLHLTGGTVDRDVDDEIAFHVETLTEELIEEGMVPHAAREEAMRRFGDQARVRRDCVEIGRRRQKAKHRVEVLSELKQDAAFALRQFRFAPGLSLIAVLTLALGIGSTAAIFSVLHAVVLRPLPLPHPERIVHLWSLERGEQRSLSPGNFFAFRNETRSLEHVSALQNAGFNLTGDGLPERILGARVSASYFAAFQARPALGRVFSEAEDQPGREQVVVLSSRLWHDRFGADPGIVGRPIRLNGLPYTVVGVMPASFSLRTDGPQMWAPMALETEKATEFSNNYLQVFGRLRPGTSLQEAQSEVTALARRLEERFPDDNKGKGALLEGFADRLVGGYRERFLILLGAVGCVLLIACVNVSNLLLARGAARSREIAIRAALGAGRGRIVRQLLTESLVLGLAGAAAGLALAYGGVRFLVAISPPGVPRLEQAAIDGTVLAFLLAVSLAASLAVGLMPALRTTRPDLQGMLKEGGRSLGGSPRDRVRSTLLVTEVALALVLLAGAGLLIRSAIRLQQVEMGFDPEGVLTAQISLPSGDYPDNSRIVATAQRILEEVQHLPGVESAAAASILPFSRWNTSSTLTIEGKVTKERSEQIDGNTRVVTPGYLSTLGVPRLRGRDFTPADREDAPRVVAINATLARMAWPGENPIGKRLAYSATDDEPDWLEVVAVVGDFRQGRLERAVQPELYLPLPQAVGFLQNGNGASLAIVAKASAQAPARPWARRGSDPSTLAEPLRRAVQAVDPRLPVFDLKTLNDLRAATVALARFNTLLLTALGLIGLVLAAVGIYGVIAYFVSQRTSEIGLRMALGATKGKVLAMIVLGAMRPVIVGLVLGLAGAFAVTRAIAGLLFEVTATDPATFAGVLVVLTAAALLASWLPARRAARVDPTRALAP